MNLFKTLLKLCARINIIILCWLNSEYFWILWIHFTHHITGQCYDWINTSILPEKIYILFMYLINRINIAKDIFVKDFFVINLWLGHRLLSGNN